MIYRREPLMIDITGLFRNPKRRTTVWVSYDTTQMQIRAERWPQPVTICIIRCEDPFITVAGVTVCNPNDIRDDAYGRKTAYKRAAHELVKQLAHTRKDIDERQWWPLFRKALYDAYQAELAAMARDQAEAGQPVQVSIHHP